MIKPIRIAYYLPTQKFIHIDNAKSGLACDCICKKCGEKLEAVQARLRTNHFRHHTNRDCEGAQETALHELAKQILLESSQIEIPFYKTIQYSDPKAEKQLENVRPDVFALYNGEPILFEINVSHAIEEEKKQFFIDRQLKSIEIDLSDRSYLTIDEVKDAILKKEKNKKIIFWDDNYLEKTKTDLHENKWNEKVFLIIVSILIVFGLPKLFKKSKKR